MMLSGKTALGQAQAAAGYSAPLLPFASFPAAIGVEGQILRPAEVPRVELMASGGLWLPRGGRQRLASRVMNPVIGRGNGVITDTIGPFPGGLVRAGMTLRFRWRFSHPAVGNPSRGFNFNLWTAASGYQTFAAGTTQGGSNTVAEGWVESLVEVLSDVSAVHRGGFNGSSGPAWGLGNSLINPTLSFADAWSLAIRTYSGNETATNITSVSWSGGVATFVNPSHTLNTGDMTTVAGVSVGGYNGVYSNITRIDANTWSGTLIANPGGSGTGGTSSRVSPITSHSYSLDFEW